MAVRTRRILTILGVVVLLAAAVGLWRWTRQPPAVETTTVQRRQVVEVYVATGQIEARRTSDVGVDLGGVVRQVAIDEGDEVERGDLLVELRPQDTEFAVQQVEARVETLHNELQQVRRGPTDAEIEAAKADVDGAEATLAQAKRELKRTRDLVADGLFTRQKLDQAETAVQEAEARLASAEARLERLRERPLPEEVRAARARLAQAKVDLERARGDVAKTSLRAPFDGLVLSVAADEGERLNPGQTVARLADMSTAEIYAEVDEDYFGRLEQDQPATLIFPSMPQKTYPATVRQIGPEISTDRGVVGVHLDPQTLPANAFPGLTVDVNIEVARLENALAVPAESVIRDGSTTYVMAVEEGRAVRRKVELRARGETWMAIAGLEAGIPIILQAAKIEAGTEVRPVEPTEKGDDR